MTDGFRLTFTPDAHGRQTVHGVCAGAHVFTYTLADGPADAEGAAAFEAPRPLMHPIFTRAGVPVTDRRPADHPWHTGLSMAWTYLVDAHDPAAEANFWGGPTYTPGTGYEQRPNLGRVRHLGWEPAAEAAFAHRLCWETKDGEPWLEETRTVALSLPEADAETGGWAMTWHMQFVNTSRRVLRLESPAARGLLDIGYGGLFMRAHPAFAAEAGGVLVCALVEAENPARNLIPARHEVPARNGSPFTGTAAALVSARARWRTRRVLGPHRALRRSVRGVHGAGRARAEAGRNARARVHGAHRRPGTGPRCVRAHRLSRYPTRDLRRARASVGAMGRSAR
jgi:hypothetical protein